MLAAAETIAGYIERGRGALLFPTAFSLQRSEGYYWNAMVFANGVAVGLTNRLSFGAGITIIPGAELSDNYYFVTPKLTLTKRSGPQLAIGALVGTIPGSDTEPRSLGMLYGVSSIGSRENNLTAGAGWGFISGDLSRRPVVIVGGQKMLTRSFGLITENWFAPDRGNYDGVATYGFRLLSGRASVGLALITTWKDPDFPGFPWAGFSIAF